jgi:hypothetical protein
MTTEDVGGQPIGGIGGIAEIAGMGGAPPLNVGGEPSAAGQAGAPESLGGAGSTGTGDAGHDGESGASPDVSELTPAEFPSLAWGLEPSRSSCINEAGEAPEGVFRVAECSDASGHGNTAKALDPTRRPLFVSKGRDERPSLKFDGDPSLLTVADSESLQFGFDAFTLLFVGRWSNSTDYEYEGDVATYPGSGAVLSKVTANFPFAGFALFVNYPGIFPGRPAIPRLAVQFEYASTLFMSYSTNLNDSKFRLYVVTRPRAGVGQIRINGRDDGSAQIPAELDVSAKGQPLMVGGWSGTPFRGDLLEVVALAGTVEQLDLERLERHFIDKYDLLR